MLAAVVFPVSVTLQLLYATQEPSNTTVSAAAGTLPLLQFAPLLHSVLPPAPVQVIVAPRAKKA